MDGTQIRSASGANPLGTIAGGPTATATPHQLGAIPFGAFMAPAQVSVTYLPNALASGSTTAVASGTVPEGTARHAAEQGYRAAHAAVSVPE